jgi:PAS domain S-box-containing protein
VLESGQPLITEEQIETADGTHTCRVSKAPLRDGEGKVVGIVGIAHDVTDLVRAGERLRQSDDRYRLAMKATNEVLWDWNVVTGDVVWSGAVARLLDCDTVPEPFPIERARTLWLERVHPEDRGRVLESFQAALKSGAEAWSMEYRHLRPDGRAPWMHDRAIILRDGAGNPLRVVGSLLEITRQKESEARLSELNRTLEARVAERSSQLLASQECLRLAVEGAAMGTWDLDMSTGTVRWSEVMARLLGYDPARVTPSFELWTSRIHPEDRQRMLAEVERVRNEGGPYQMEYRILTADTGELRWVSSRGRPTRDGQGRIRLLSGVSFDVSTLKRAQEALQRALEESDAFARNAAHELRAPLRAMSCTAQLLLDEGTERRMDAGTRDLFQRLVEAARRLDTMTQDLLAYSRMSQEDMPRVTIDTGAVVGQVLGQMKEDILARRAEVDVLAPLHPVRGRAQTLGHALSNLLYNAIKFVPPGVAPRVTVRSEARGAWIRLWVEDNGIGIDPASQGRLFKVFERLSSDYPGSGVGLAMVKKGLERMGGRVGLESQVDRGSRFWIELPNPEDVTDESGGPVHLP